MGEVCLDSMKMGEIEVMLTKNDGLLIDIVFHYFKYKVDG